MLKIPTQINAKVLTMAGIPSVLVPILAYGFMQLTEIPKTYVSKIDNCARIERMEKRIDKRFDRIEADLRIILHELTKRN